MSISSDLLREIDAFVRRAGMAPTTFGRLAANDGKLVARLRGGKGITTGTVEKIRSYIRDNGPGLSEEAFARLFEPFFTTKPAGQGLGLGLTLSAGILDEVGGSLEASNHPDGGACFTLVLPLARLDPESRHGN